MMLACVMKRCVWLALNVLLVSVVYEAVTAAAVEPSHPIYSKLSGGGSSSYGHQRQQAAEDRDAVLLKVYEKLAEVVALDEQQLKRLDAIEYKINRLEVSNQERIEAIRTQLVEVGRHVANLDYVAAKIEGTTEQLKDGVEALKESRVSRTAASTTSSSASITAAPVDIPEKLNALAVLTTSVRSAVHRIEREVHGMALNTTQLMQNVNYLQRNVPTKQYLNTAILGVKSQPVYTVMQSPSGNGGEYVLTNGVAVANGSIPSNCKYAARKFGINKIRLVSNTYREPFFVNCIDGWTVIQTRDDGGVSFYRNWAEYKHGFGNIGGEFWIGLDKLFELTASRIHELMIDFEDWEGVTRKAKYSNFAIGSEKENFALVLLGKYSGDAGDALSYHAGQKFSTFDADNDSWPEGNCAQAHAGAWWYNACDTSNLNGRYLGGETPDELRYQGIYWQEFKGSNYSLRKVRMMIRPVD